MKYIVSILLLCASMSVMAQNEDRRAQAQQREFSPEEYWKNLKEFVTKEASLSDSEASAFYPLLKEMMDKQRENGHQAMEMIRSTKNDLSEEEYGKIIDKLTKLEVDNKQIEQEYYMRFHDVLSWQKTFKVRGALYKYKREALTRFRPHPQK